MAATLRPSDAFNYCKTLIKQTKLDDVEFRIMDDVNKYMWMAAPWRWTIGSMPTVTMANNQQDYSITLPGDFLYLHEAYVSDGTTPPRDLVIEPSLPATTKLVGQPNRMAVSTGQYRVAPVPANFPGVAPTIVSLYKKQAPIIDSGNAGTAGALVFDDEWFWVYVEGFLWKAYQYADDDRAGAVTFADGKVQYTGQRGSFEAGLQFMRQNEKLYLPARSKEP